MSLFDENHLGPIWAFCQSEQFRTLVRQLDVKLNVTNATIGKVTFDLTRWQREWSKIGELPPRLTNNVTQWIFTGAVTASINPLQVAVIRLLGYQWPEQKTDKLDKHADDDGVVGIAAIMREKPAAERLRELLATAYGKEWSPAKEAELLHSVGFGDGNLEDWLRNGFFEQHCKLFHQCP